MDAAWSNFLFQVSFCRLLFFLLIPPEHMQALSVCHCHPSQRLVLPPLQDKYCDLCLHLVMAFSLLLQSTPTQNQVEGSLQSELMQVHTSSPQTPPTEHIAQPPSTVDTTALSEEPLPGESDCTLPPPLELKSLPSESIQVNKRPVKTCMFSARCILSLWKHKD